MANPRLPGGAGSGPGTGMQPPLPSPVDPDELQQTELLAEAMLVSFAATPNPVPPYGKAKIAWQITMPTTAIPGVHVEIHLTDGEGGEVMIEPAGEITITPFGESEWSIYLKTHKAVRSLGSVLAAVDLGACKTKDVAPIVLTAIIKDQAEQPFKAGGRISLRGHGATVDFGINAFVVYVPLRAEVPDWFNADVDVKMGFELFSELGVLKARHSFATTDVSPGFLSTVLSFDCASAVVDGVEATSDGFLTGFVGPKIAEEMRNQVQAQIDADLRQLNADSMSGPLKFHDIALTQDGMTFRFCPAHPARPNQPPTGPGGGGLHPVSG